MNYENLLREMQSLAEHVSYPITNLANASALLFEEMDRLNWAGFYIRHGEELLLGPFQGKVACTRIPLGQGVCGTAAKSGQTQLVKDVHEFPGHIACDSASNSEIVVPLWKDGEVWGVLDIDQIKTPIAAMSLLLQEEDTPENGELSMELFRIEQYVEMVLQYLRLDSPDHDLAFRSVDVDDCVRQAVRKYARSFIRKKIALDFQETGSLADG